jgi:hypothetical protein
VVKEEQRIPQLSGTRARGVFKPARFPLPRPVEALVLDLAERQC